MEHFKFIAANQPDGQAEYAFLAYQRQLLADLLDLNGVPPSLARKPGFSSLVRIILEQAVSLESARTVYEKCE